MNYDAVGLDLSLTSTGYADDEILESIAVKTKGPQRLIDIREKVMFNISLLNAPCVAIEGYSYGSRNSQAHSIGELGGVIRVALHESEIPYVDIPPTCRAKFATGKGNAGKNEVVSSVSARTGIVWSGKGADDMCDAWILQEMVLTKLGLARYDWPKINLDSLDKVDWTTLGV